MKKNLTVVDLKPTHQASVDWASATVTLNVEGVKADRLTFTYYYDGNVKWRSVQRYLDVDNVVVKSGNVSLCSADLENAPITTANKKELSVDYSAISPSSKQNYMLRTSF